MPLVGNGIKKNSSINKLLVVVVGQKQPESQVLSFEDIKTLTMSRQAGNRGPHSKTTTTKLDSAHAFTNLTFSQMNNTAGGKILLTWLFRVVKGNSLGWPLWRPERILLT